MRSNFAASLLGLVASGAARGCVGSRSRRSHVLSEASKSRIVSPFARCQSRQFSVTAAKSSHGCSCKAASLNAADGA